MKTSRSKVRRELVLLFGVTVLALVPLGCFWWRSVVAARSQFALRLVLDHHVLGTVAGQARQAFLSPPQPAFLSPDGAFIARLESRAADAGVVKDAVCDQLVVRRASDGEEVWRRPAIAKFVGWKSGSSDFVTQDGRAVQVFRRGHATGAPKVWWMETSIPLAPTQNQLPLSDNSDGSIPTHSAVANVAFSPDLNYAVDVMVEKGDLWWRVADLQTLKVWPRVKAGRLLAFSAMAAAVAPCNLSTGARPVVVLMQKPGVFRASFQGSWVDVKTFQADCFDLSSGQRRWRVAVKSLNPLTQLQFAPDGSALVAIQTAWLSDIDGGWERDCGLEFRSPQTGRVYARNHARLIAGLSPLRYCFYWLSPKSDGAHPTSVFTLCDKIPDGDGFENVLRFFKATDGEEIGHLSLDPQINDFEKNVLQPLTFSPDKKGQMWLIGKGNYLLEKRSRIGQEVSGPMAEQTYELPSIIG